MVLVDIDAGVGALVFAANAHRRQPKVYIQYGQGVVLISTPTYALQCALREVQYNAGHGRPGSIESRRIYYGHIMSQKEVGRL